MVVCGMVQLLGCVAKATIGIFTTGCDVMSSSSYQAQKALQDANVLELKKHDKRRPCGEAVRQWLRNSMNALVTSWQTVFPARAQQTPEIHTV
jgi:hypothetical protein